jgi:hypothetical protein
MFVVLVGGYPNQRAEFMEMVKPIDDDRIVWVDDKKSFYYIANLFVYFGGPVSIPTGKLMITWSGDNLETLHRVYKTLGV